MILPALLAASLLAQKPAADAPRPYDVQHYRIEMRLSNDGAFDNEAQVTLVPHRALPAVELDSFGLDVKSVTLDGKEVPFTVADDAAARTGLLTLRPTPALAARKPVTFAIRYSGTAAAAHEGFFRAVDTAPAKGERLPYFFTHFQPDYARRFFPSNDRPDDKATSELYAIVDARYQVLSNGTRVLDEAFSEKGENLRRVHWKQETPHPAYLVAVAVGAFEGVELSASVPATLWLQPGRKDRSHWATQATEHGLTFQQRYLGVKYPWAKYDQVSVPQFFWGGMENTSLVMMRENGLVLEERNYVHGRTRISSLVAHELAHQWFGNYVTCKDWSDIWLNEGFATFLTWKTEDAFYDNDLIELSRFVRIHNGYFREEDGPRSRPLVNRSASARDGFDATSYTKGAGVLRMLEHWVGDAQFRKGLQSYLEKHAHQNATSEQFFDTFMKATGTEKELRAFRDAWLYRRGYPVITPETRWDGQALHVTLRQAPNHDGEKGHFVFKLPVVFHREGTTAYAKEEVILMDKPVVTVKVDLPAAPQWVNWNRDGVALARIHAPAVSEQAWTHAARHDPDPVWRAQALFVLLGTLGERDAPELKIPSDAAMDAVSHALRADPSPYVRHALLERLAGSKWKRLPEVLAPIVLDLARRPQGLAEDALGTVRVRRGAMAALGKFDHKPGRTYLLEQVNSAELDLNYLPAMAAGVANLGDSVALATLNAAITRARPRGYAYYKELGKALGAVTSPDVVPSLEALLNDNPGNAELVTELLWMMADNQVLKASPEYAAFVRRFVVENARFGDDVKGRVLRTLDEVKTAEAHKALAGVAEGASSSRLQDSARRVLDKNFPPAPAPAAVPAAARGKKKP
jgi:hypothetical protein